VNDGWNAAKAALTETIDATMMATKATNIRSLFVIKLRTSLPGRQG